MVRVFKPFNRFLLFLGMFAAIFFVPSIPIFRIAIFGTYYDLVVFMVVWIPMSLVFAMLANFIWSFVDKN